MTFGIGYCGVSTGHLVGGTGEAGIAATLPENVQVTRSGRGGRRAHVCILMLLADIARCFPMGKEVALCRRVFHMG